MHTDSATTFESDQLLASATARGVPMVSGRQMLTWLDGRNGSSFSAIAWSGNTLSFTVDGRHRRQRADRDGARPSVHGGRP